MKISISFFFCLLTVSMYGQNPVNPEDLLAGKDNVIPPSPTAASLGKFGGEPVNLSTGTANITIPLYTGQSRSLAIPLSLSYQTTGVRVEEIASWVGLGWALSAGGVISRTVRGLPDESSKGYYNANLPADCYFPPDCQNFIDGGWDAHADLFYFSLPGRSGKIVFPENGSESDGKVIPYENLQVKRYVVNNGQGFFWYFKITDEAGTIYTFSDANGRAIEQTFSESSCGDNPGAQSFDSSWYLTRIESAQGDDVITFKYASTNLQYDAMATQQKIYISGPSNCGEDQSFLCKNSIVILGERLDSIITEREILTFAANTTRLDIEGTDKKRLDALKVFTTGGTEIRRFELAYDYFPGSNQRLRLLSVQEKSPGIGPTKPPYLFTYNSTTLPDRNSYSIDHWGYYNHAVSNTRYIPTVDLGFTLYSGADREPNANYMQAGVLTKVTYPTGGFTEFEYEPHTYGYVGSTEVQQRTLTGSSGSVSKSTSVGLIPEQYNSMTFSINFDQTIKISYNCANTSGNPEFGASRLEVLRVSDGAGMASYHYNQQSITYLYLLAGSYEVRAYVSDPGDVSSATLWWYNENLSALYSKTASGLRIKTLTEHDGISSLHDVVKHYTYTTGSGQNLRSSGVANAEPQYVKSASFYVQGDVNISEDQFPHEEYECSQVILSSQTTLPLAYAPGSPIFYKEVTETLGNGDQGKTIYKFRTHPDGGGGIPGSTYRTARDYLRGKPTETGVYDKNNSLRRKMIHTYTDETSLSRNYSFVESLNIAYKENHALEDSNDIFYLNFYEVISQWSYISSTETVEYDSMGNELPTTIDYYYEEPQHIQVSRTEQTNSEGTIYKTERTYPADYDFSASSFDAHAQALKSLKDKHIHQPIIEQRVWQKKSNESNFSLINGQVVKYKIFQGTDIHPAESWKAEMTTPVSSVSFNPSEITPSGIFEIDNRYQPLVHFDNYDTYGNLIETHRESSPVRNSYLWGYDAQVPTAQTLHAAASEIAYTSFEGDEKGNWTYFGTSVSGGKTGSKSFTLTSQTVQRTGLPAGDYGVSFWSDGTGVTINGHSTAVYAVHTDKGGWSLFRYPVTLGANGSVVVTGSGKIDELRLHPADAQMTTYCYDELLRVQTVSDVNSQSVYYAYDDLGRLIEIKDQDGYIVQQYDYHYKND
ncbi:MAG: hypothetical protein SF052_17050 [Bacteroidia bacterium]|nr:hypothetical protein [Bacteroidia bacterium]